MSQLEVQLRELKLKEQAKRADIKRYVGSLDSYVSQSLQLKEQVDIYQEALREMRVAPICSLKEFREMSAQLLLARKEYRLNAKKIELTEDLVREQQTELDKLLENISVVEANMPTYGQLYRFPSRDH